MHIFFNLYICRVAKRANHPLDNSVLSGLTQHRGTELGPAVLEVSPGSARRISESMKFSISTFCAYKHDITSCSLQ